MGANSTQFMVLLVGAIHSCGFGPGVQCDQNVIGSAGPHVEVWLTLCLDLSQV